jgi:hypothetical protein
MEHWEIIKLKNLGEKYTVLRTQGIPNGPGWYPTHVCMVTDLLNEYNLLDKFVFL